MQTSNVISHAENVENFERLVKCCHGFGTVYCPSNPNLSPESLTTLLHKCQSVKDSVASAEGAYERAHSEREARFKVLPILCDRIMLAMESSGVSPETLRLAAGIILKLRERRLGNSAELSMLGSGFSNQEPEGNFSASHQGFDRQLNGMSGLIQLLANESSYFPQEMELTVSALNGLLSNLEASNRKAKLTTVALNNAYIERDSLLYLSENSICDLAQEIKSYIKLVFGDHSSEFKLVESIQFSLIEMAV